ncbi:uncharacterized protein A1O5_07287, partial [Cladophialophora psammophila CBS 110553]
PGNLHLQSNISRVQLSPSCADISKCALTFNVPRQDIISLTVSHRHSVRTQIEANKWLDGGEFKHCQTHHFHRVTPECYAVFCGRGRLLLGKGQLDENAQGREVE